MSADLWKERESAYCSHCRSDQLINTRWVGNRRMWRCVVCQFWIRCPLCLGMASTIHDELCSGIATHEGGKNE